MPSSPNPNPAKQFILALVVVLSGVVLGSFIVMKKEEHGRTQRPFPSPIAATPRGDVNRNNSSANDMVWIPGGTFSTGSELRYQRPRKSPVVHVCWEDAVA